MRDFGIRVASFADFLIALVLKDLGLFYLLEKNSGSLDFRKFSEALLGEI